MTPTEQMPVAGVWRLGFTENCPPSMFVMCSSEGISAALPGLLVDNWGGWARFLRGLLGLLGLGNWAAPAPSPPWACLPFLLASALG